MWLRPLSVWGSKRPEMLALNGRGERIRTSGPCLPKTVLYQAELLPDPDFMVPFGAWEAGACL